MKFCEKCGKEILDEAVVCPACGCEVKDKEVVSADHPKKGMCIASLVLGIVSLVLSCIWYISIPAAIVGLVLGIVGNKAKKSSMAIAGIVLSIISLCLVILFLTVLATFIAQYGSQLGSSNL